MRIQNNIMALNTWRQLGINNLNQEKSTEKLSSGYRINRAADDAAGLYISEKMRAQIRGLNMASANAQDGISLVQAAEGALQETHSILQRMRELAVKAANDVNESEDRGAIQAELDQLMKEVDRIAFTTEFNKKTLLDGSLRDGVKTAKSISGSGVSAGIVVGNSVTSGIYNIEISSAGVFSKAVWDITKLGVGSAADGEVINIEISAFSNTATNSSAALEYGLDDISSGVIVSYVATGDEAQDNATAVNMLKDVLSSILKDYEVTSEGNNIILTALKVGEHATSSGIDLVANFATSGSTSIISSTSAIQEINAGVNEIVEVKFAGTTETAQASTRVGYYSFGTAADGLDFTFRMDDVTKKYSAVVDVKAGRSLTFQVGANSSVDQTIKLAVRNLSAAALGIDNISVHNNEAGRATIAAVEKALSTVSEQRSALGAVQNRLEHTVANLDTVAENLTAAESRIRDVDMAKEMMNFTKNNILTQAATAMLAQANQNPQTVLQLLR